MPCYSIIRTNLIEIASIEKAARALGMSVERSSNTITITAANRNSGVNLQRDQAGAKFYIDGYYGDYAEVIEPLTQAYAKEQLKVYARKNGYTIEPTKVAGEYVLVGQE